MKYTGEEVDFAETSSAVTDETFTYCNDDDVEVELQGYVVYATHVALIESWIQYKPLSGVLVTAVDEAGNANHEFYCCVKEVDGKKAIQFELKGEQFGEYIFGLYYHSYEMVNEIEKIDWNKLTVSKYAILLPKIIEAEDGKHEYATVTSDWMTTDRWGSITQSHCQLLVEELHMWDDGKPIEE